MLNIFPNKSFHLSLGRRLIKWGPGFYDIQIADSQPYLDNLWANYKTNITDSWIFNYNYVLVAPKFWLQYENSVQKTILGHKFSFYNDNLRLSLGELSNIYNKINGLNIPTILLLNKADIVTIKTYQKIQF